jgi:hypothetical protein
MLIRILFLLRNVCEFTKAIHIRHLRNIVKIRHRRHGVRIHSTDHLSSRIPDPVIPVSHAHVCVYDDEAQ